MLFHQPVLRSHDSHTWLCLSITPRDLTQQVWGGTGHLCFLSSTDDFDQQPGLGVTPLHRDPTSSPWAKYTLKTYVHPTHCFKMFWISCQFLQIVIFLYKKWS